MENNKYQKNYSKINPQILKYETRLKKAEKILAVLKDFLNNKRLRESICLDIGCSIGATGVIIGPRVKKFIGVDIDRNAIRLAKKNNREINVRFELADAMNLNLRDKTIDIVICNQVYEHVPNQSKLFSEIHRVLKDGGICYLGAANKFSIIEPHTKLPFLSWFPKKIANFYLKVAKGEKSYYENLNSYWKFKRILRKFVIYDYTMKILKDPMMFHADDVVKKNIFLNRVPNFVLKSLICFIPSWIWILKKY
jgi:ubiquinone/menaquinone biosynthesis C-methylase UbiE